MILIWRPGKKIVKTGLLGKFNGILWVVSANDRVGMNDAILREGMEFLLTNYSDDNVILVLTHCDQYENDSIINTKEIAKEWVDAFNSSLKKPIKLKAAITFGVKPSNSYSPNYHKELADLVESGNYSSLMDIQSEINYKEFSKHVLDAVDPKIAKGVENLLKEQLDMMTKQNEEFQKRVLEANEKQIKALIEANKPCPLLKGLQYAGAALDLIGKYQRLNTRSKSREIIYAYPSYEDYQDSENDDYFDAVNPSD